MIYSIGLAKSIQDVFNVQARLLVKDQMAAEVILIAGLPGSGKTTHMDAMQR
jgi:predicted PilT family ATPase